MRKGKLYVVGIGPGDTQHLTFRARYALSRSQVIVGYTAYIKLIKGLVERKNIIATGMKQEVSRVRQAIEEARNGKIVSLVSSGDAGVYGMAGLVFQLSLGTEQSSVSADRLRIEVIPGVTAASSCAALLGAPLMNDFAVISLSDLLADRYKIEEKLKAAAKSDFIIVFYNPQSKKRVKLLEKAWEIILKYRPLKTPVGIVKNAYRYGEEVKITNLKEAPSVKDIDMVTTIIVGNSETYRKNKYMITPRGYKLSDV